MVHHRPPDTRLLTHLLNHEREYTKQLLTLLATSSSSLASLSAYAASTSPIENEALKGVVGVLAGVDSALRRYGGVVEKEWIERMARVKEVEEVVGGVGRDREILVTRLIKASNVKALSSTSSSSSYNPPSKLLAAQTELQACEAHLSAKELELSKLRYALLKDGLGARMRALLDCALVFGQLGRDGLAFLDALDAATTTTESLPAASSSSLRLAPPQPRPLSTATTLTTYTTLTSFTSGSASEGGSASTPTQPQVHSATKTSLLTYAPAVSLRVPPSAAVDPPPSETGSETILPISIPPPHALQDAGWVDHEIPFASTAEPAPVDEERQVPIQDQEKDDEEESLAAQSPSPSSHLQVTAPAESSSPPFQVNPNPDPTPTSTPSQSISGSESENESNPFKNKARKGKFKVVENPRFVQPSPSPSPSKQKVKVNSKGKERETDNMDMEEEHQHQHQQEDDPEEGLVIDLGEARARAQAQDHRAEMTSDTSPRARGLDPSTAASGAGSPSLNATLIPTTYPNPTTTPATPAPNSPSKRFLGSLRGLFGSVNGKKGHLKSLSPNKKKKGENLPPSVVSGVSLQRGSSRRRAQTSPSPSPSPTMRSRRATWDEDSSDSSASSDPTFEGVVGRKGSLKRQKKKGKVKNTKQPKGRLVLGGLFSSGGGGDENRLGPKPKPKAEVPVGLGRSIGVVDMSTNAATGGHEGRAGSVDFHFSAQQQSGMKRMRTASDTGVAVAVAFPPPPLPGQEKGTRTRRRTLKKSQQQRGNRDDNNKESGSRESSIRSGNEGVGVGLLGFPTSAITTTTTTTSGGGGTLKKKSTPGPPVAGSAERARDMRMNVNLNPGHRFGSDTDLVRAGGASGKGSLMRKPQAARSAASPPEAEIDRVGPHPRRRRSSHSGFDRDTTDAGLGLGLGSPSSSSSLIGQSAFGGVGGGSTSATPKQQPLKANSLKAASASARGRSSSSLATLPAYDRGGIVAGAGASSGAIQTLTTSSGSVPGVGAGQTQAPLQQQQQKGQKNPETQSLMSIVENVARMNREGWATTGSGSGSASVPSLPLSQQPKVQKPRMEIVKAPPRVGRDVLERMEVIGESSRGDGSLLNLKGVGRVQGTSSSQTTLKPLTSFSPPASAAMPTTGTTGSSTMPIPLKSALKHPASSSRESSTVSGTTGSRSRSRTPSPLPLNLGLSGFASAMTTTTTTTTGNNNGGWRRGSPGPSPLRVPGPAPALVGQPQPQMNRTHQHQHGQLLEVKAEGFEERVGDDVDRGDEEDGSISGDDDDEGDSVYETASATSGGEEELEGGFESGEEMRLEKRKGDDSTQSRTGKRQPQEQQQKEGIQQPQVQVQANNNPPQTPRKRKSVRVSLQPTFSPSPPAIEVEDEDGFAHGQDQDQDRDGFASGLERRRSREDDNLSVDRRGSSTRLRQERREGEGEGEGGWQDSSDEDEVYRRAKVALARAGSR